MIQRFARPVSLIALPLAIAGCERRPDNVPVAVSVIGDGPTTLPARPGDPMSTPVAVLTGATAQGLVRFDASGQVEPGLAERWIVIDNGRSYIFRLREAHWSDGSRVTAEQVVAGLRRAIANRRNPLAPHLSAISEVVEMTPLVIEVRLSRPRPDLLPLFAAPELAVPGPPRARGSGPFHLQQRSRTQLTLRPVPDPDQVDLDEPDDPDPEEFVDLRTESAARAIVRFRERGSDLVMGGTFLDWPLVDLIGPAPANRRIDPASGLFGLAVTRRQGFMNAVVNREAVAMAIDRTALTQAFANEWSATDAILPDQLDSSAPPTQPNWVAFDLNARRQAAILRVDSWRNANGGNAPQLTVSMPDGPGAKRLTARLIADLASIGVLLRRVGPTEKADLRLVDLVSPYDSARWYLRGACQPCATPIAEMLDRARASGDLTERSALLAQADEALVRDVAFIPLAQPMRWSLTAVRLREWRGNARAWHPLNHLRRETN